MLNRARTLFAALATALGQRLQGWTLRGRLAAKEHHSFLFSPTAIGIGVALTLFGAVGLAVLNPDIQHLATTIRSAVLGPQSTGNGTATPVVSSAPVELGPMLRIEFVRLHPDAHYFEPPAQSGPVDVSGLRSEYTDRSFEDAVNIERCISSNEQIYGYFLANLIMRNEGRGGREAALEIARAVEAAVQGPESDRAVSAPRARYYRGLLQQNFDADPDSEFLVSIAHAARVMIETRGAAYFAAPQENDIPIPMDGGAILDVVVRNTGDSPAYITQAWFETVSTSLAGIGQGGGETLNAYPLETTATLTFSTNDETPVVFRNPIVVPADGIARFVVNVAPVPNEERRYDYYVEAWVGRIHFDGPNGEGLATDPVCVLLPFEPTEDFW